MQTRSACRTRCCYTVAVIPSMVAGMFPPRPSECGFIVLSYEVVCFSWQVGGDLSYDTDPFCSSRSWDSVFATFKKPWGLVTRHFLLLMAWPSSTIDVGALQSFPPVGDTIKHLFQNRPSHGIFKSDLIRTNPNFQQHLRMGTFSCFFVS